ncbi:hypothetical protein [Hyphomicrobium sp.]|uniref:hypothetical protein n=1 Tax=Hyphomicrobium sp. TaxID=82 RepID=UPI003F6F7293
MNTKLVAIGAAILAAASLASAAEAGGGGVRLGFGGPLGTFVATPAHGGGGGGGYHNKPTKRPPVVQAARKQELHAARKPEKPARIAKVQQPGKAEATKTEAVTAAPSKTEEIAPAATGSSALIQGSIPADNSAEQPEAISPVEPAAPRAEAPADTVTANTDKAPDENDCKKFIPAIGTTVSVGCGN